MATSTERTTPSPGRGPEEAPRFLPLETVSVRLQALSAGDRAAFGILSNISETGACVILNAPAAAGESVSVELESPRWRDELSVTAVVVWSAEKMEPVKEIVGYLTGLRFEKSATETIRARLRSGIFQLIPG